MVNVTARGLDILPVERGSRTLEVPHVGVYIISPNSETLHTCLYLSFCILTIYTA